MKNEVIIKNEILIHRRVFPVLVWDRSASKEVHTTVTVAKQQLQAAQIVGQSSKEFIEHLCDRQGFTVLKIGKPVRMSVALDLNKLAGGAGV